MATKKSIRECYAKSVSYEWKRTVKDEHHKLEHNTTWHFLNKYLPKKGLILDAGGGPGRYTTELAKEGYDVVLLDYTPANLEFAKKQIKKAKLQHKVKDIVEGSIVDLSRFKNNTFDAVICVGGPLSHVKGAANRQKAVSELIRVAKKGAPIFVAVMGKYGVLMVAASYFPEEVRMAKHFARLSQKGDDYHWHGKYYSHFFVPDELKQMFSKNKVKILKMTALEGLSVKRDDTNKLAKDKLAWKNWLKAHYKLCTQPAVIAISEHFMIVCRKK
jgi:ubiquinone/menaquinone biosynthesis C-methylase UbiE